MQISPPLDVVARLAQGSKSTPPPRGAVAARTLQFAKRSLTTTIIGASQQLCRYRIYCQNLSFLSRRGWFRAVGEPLAVLRGHVVAKTDGTCTLDSAKWFDWRVPTLN